MKQKLYWVPTLDHGEDWFIVASNVMHTERLHEQLEGYDSGDADAEEIIAIPDTLAATPGWPAEALFAAVGAKYIESGATRAVEIDGRIFYEGLLEETVRSLDDDRFETQGPGRVNGTRKASKNPL